jgi:predicted nucleic acid-binding protein
MLMSHSRQVFLDTSFVFALDAKDDMYHLRAKAWDRLLSSRRVPVILHIGILLEIADGFSRLHRRPKGMEFLEKFTHEDGFDVYTIDDSLLEEATQLYLQRPDKE